MFQFVLDGVNLWNVSMLVLFSFIAPHVQVAAKKINRKIKMQQIHS